MRNNVLISVVDGRLEGSREPHSKMKYTQDPRATKNLKKLRFLTIVVRSKTLPFFFFH